MKKIYYFMAGLPRSGSSLLSVLLNQNPRFYCGPSSPLLGMSNGFEGFFENNELYNAYPKPGFEKATTQAMFDSYYADTDKPVVIDKNRGWTQHVHKAKYFLDIENPKVIVTVRNVDEVLASFIDMIHRNKSTGTNFIDKGLAERKISINDTNRCYAIGGPEGPLGRSYDNIKFGIQKGHLEHFHFVEYNDLVKNPEQTMQKLYEFLGEENYQHDFDNIVKTADEDDGTIYGLPDMHTVRTSLDFQSKDPKIVLPKEVYDSVQGMEFWHSFKQ